MSDAPPKQVYPGAKKAGPQRGPNHEYALSGAEAPAPSYLPKRLETSLHLMFSMNASRYLGRAVP